MRYHAPSLLHPPSPSSRAGQGRTSLADTARLAGRKPCRSRLSTSSSFSSSSPPASTRSVSSWTGPNSARVAAADPLGACRASRLTATMADETRPSRPAATSFTSGRSSTCACSAWSSTSSSMAQRCALTTPLESSLAAPQGCAHTFDAGRDPCHRLALCGRWHPQRHLPARLCHAPLHVRLPCALLLRYWTLALSDASLRLHSVAFVFSLFVFSSVSHIYYSLRAHHANHSGLDTLFVHLPFSLWHAWSLVTVSPCASSISSRLGESARSLMWYSLGLTDLHLGIRGVPGEAAQVLVSTQSSLLTEFGFARTAPRCTCQPRDQDPGCARARLLRHDLRTSSKSLRLSQACSS